MVRTARTSNGRTIALLAIAALATAAACGRFEGRDAPAAERRALDLIERLAAGPRSVTWHGDVVTDPPFVPLLVAMGRDAVPVLLDEVRRTDDAWQRNLLLHVLGRSADARAAAALEHLLADERSREAALAALTALAQPRSLPALRARLATATGGGRVRVLGAILCCGDATVLGEVLRIGLGGDEYRYEAVQALLRHEPLRKALGFTDPDQGGVFVDDELLFLRAADEWHHEAVLGERSPWRPLAPSFQEPFAAAKEAAFAKLVRHVAARDDDATALRVHATDPVIPPGDAGQPMLVLTGTWHHHGGTLAVHVWCAGDPVVAYRLVPAWRGARSPFPGDDRSVECTRITVPRAAYAELRAGMRTALDTRLVPWWTGPTSSVWFASLSHAFAVTGLGDDARHRHCAAWTSEDRADQERLAVALALHDEALAGHAGVACTGVPAEARSGFAALFRSLVSDPLPQGDWSWVRAHMVAMARDAGDLSLRAPLARCLRPWRPGDDRAARTAAHAVAALAAITGIELRFDALGAPRPLADVAAEYHALFAR